MLYTITAKWDDSDSQGSDAVGWMLDQLSALGCYDVEIDESQEKPKTYVSGGPKEKS
jgi:hypothetical protein